MSPDSSSAGESLGARLQIDPVADDPSTLALVGDLDPHTAPQLEAALAARIAGGAEAIRLDVTGLDFIDSSGLRVLVEAHRALGGEPGSLRLASVSATFRRLLEMTGLDRHLTIESTS
jgi:anti-sigma B factor antagonist